MACRGLFEGLEVSVAAVCDSNPLRPFARHGKDPCRPNESVFWPLPLFLTYEKTLLNVPRKDHQWEFEGNRSRVRPRKRDKGYGIWGVTTGRVCFWIVRAAARREALCPVPFGLSPASMKPCSGTFFFSGGD